MSRTISYAIVSQNNWTVPRRDRDGRLIYHVGFRPPPSMREAASWPGTYIIQQPLDAPPPRIFGHGTYAELGGIMTMVADYFDSSG